MLLNCWMWFAMKTKMKQILLLLLMKCLNIVDRIETEAFIGLLLLAGAYKAQYRPVSELWSLKEGQPVFRATMSEQRFKSIKGAMWFDDPSRRDRSDRLAPVRFIFDLITEKFRSFMIASENLTIDEQLIEYHGRVDFKQYIGTKPGKFGIKIYRLTEAKSSYCLAGFVYIGADSIPEYITEESSSTTEPTLWYLMQHFIGKTAYWGQLVHNAASNWPSQEKSHNICWNNTQY